MTSRSKLGEARSFAEGEVSEYRREREQDFGREEQEKSQAAEVDLQNRLGQAEKTAEIEQDFNDNKDKVIDELLQRIMTVSMDVPRAVREKFV